ncbi:MAG: nuclear transport factor 2 family protein [Saprospiraceae bacterium]|nr:nuclear transport factor 2 family protein [Saprospiraceae bacterium]
MTRIATFWIFSICLACTGEVKTIDLQQVEQDIVKVEEAFSAAVVEVGIKQAFLSFAADDAVMVRGNRVVEGKEAIAAFFDQSTMQNVQLEWTPDFVDVAEAGDMAYTYGQYTYAATDTAGAQVTSLGIFHTVWKRQSDGGWKFVYD